MKLVLTKVIPINVLIFFFNRTTHGVSKQVNHETKKQKSIYKIYKKFA